MAQRTKATKNPTASGETKKAVTKKTTTPAKAKTKKAVQPPPGPSTKQVKIGQKAPAFSLPNQDGKVVRLSDFKGKKVVLYFYPKDDTPGCTTEACNFRDDIFKLRALDAEVLGVSLDSTESHARFAEKYGLPFPLLSDAAGETAGQYGCLTEWRGMTIAARHTFIIDPGGNIAKIYRKVDPDTHSAQVLADLATLQAD